MIVCYIEAFTCRAESSVQEKWIIDWSCCNWRHLGAYERNYTKKIDFLFKSVREGEKLGNTSFLGPWTSSMFLGWMFPYRLLNHFAHLWMHFSITMCMESHGWTNSIPHWLLLKSMWNGFWVVAERDFFHNSTLSQDWWNMMNRPSHLFTTITSCFLIFDFLCYVKDFWSQCTG